MLYRYRAYIRNTETHHFIDVLELGGPGDVLGGVQEERLQRQRLGLQAVRGQQRDVGRLRGQQEQQRTASPPYTRTIAIIIRISDGRASTTLQYYRLQQNSAYIKKQQCLPFLAVRPMRCT